MAYSARLFQCQKTKTIRGSVLPAATTLRPKGGEVGSILESPDAQRKSVNGGVTRPSGRHYRRLWRRLERQVACKVLRTTEGPRTEKARTRVEPQIPVQVSLSIGDDAGLTSMKADLDRRREPLTMKVIIGDDRGQSSTPTMWGGRLLRPAAHTGNQWTSRKLRRECRECPDMCRFLGRLHDKTAHALPRQASEKRQGTKSRAGRDSVSPLRSMGI
jgi:hypothetical protein